MKWFVLVLLTLSLSACTKEVAVDPNAGQQTPGQQPGQAGNVQAPTAAQAPRPAPGAGGGVQIHGSGAVPNAPVTGTESLQGGGAGGIHQAAKGQAQRAAGQAGQTSVDVGE